MTRVLSAGIALLVLIPFVRYGSPFSFSLLVAAAAAVGTWEFLRLTRFPGNRIALGLASAAGAALAALFMGGTFLDYSAFTPEHPQHGQHWGIFLVELGVGLTVSAVMLVIYFVFTARPRSRAERNRQAGSIHPPRLTLPEVPELRASDDEGAP